MRNQAKEERRTAPYLFDYYNINAFMSGTISSVIQNPMVKMVNCIVEAINHFQLLPRFIIIIPDQDVVAAIKYYDYGISKIIQRCMEWMVREVDRMISTRKEDLWDKRPGAICPLEPKVVWIKMLEKPAQSRIMAVRNKFNAILEEILCRYRLMYIAGIQLEHMHFDRNNSLYPTGKIRYWKDLDAIMKKFDLQ